MATHHCRSLVLGWLTALTLACSSSSILLDVHRDIQQFESLGSSTNVPDYEFNALHELYEATNGPHWTWGDQPGAEWNFTTSGANPCADDWQGITCTYNEIDGYKHVEVLSLNAYNLVGYLPASIGNLTYLRNLTMSANSLTHSTIPETIGLLNQLEELYISESGFVGTIPQSMGNMSSLLAFDLSYNKLTDTFPTCICSLQRLTSLHLEGNQLTGSIPDCIGQLANLQALICNYNMLNGSLPSSIGDLSQLHGLSVGINQITGTIPDSFAALSQLQILGLSNNQLIGTIPEFIGTYTHLLELDLDTNFLTGTIPAALGNLVQLEVLYIFSNKLNGTMPQSLGNLTFLVDFDVDNNVLSGTVPAFLGNYLGMLYISLYDNQFSSTLPETLCNLLLLGELDFGSNYISGSIPACIGNLSRMLEFIGSDNLLTGTVPPALFLLPVLSSIELSNNLLSGPLPSPPTAGEPSRLFFLSMSINQLTGSIPVAINNYRDLLYVNLSHNALTGPVPDSICRLPNLNYLYLGNNRLSGRLPSCWQDLNSTLSYLFVNHNHLTGSIPASLGELGALQSLNLSSNSLSSSIPPSLAKLRSLQVLLLQANKLTGPIYHMVNASTQLNFTVMELSDNQLSGTLPDELFSLERLQVFAAVSNCFTGSIPVSACDSNTLVTLALDGLQSATYCQNKLFPSSFDGVVAPNLYSISSPITGGIPMCLFRMANLTTLHLSGNGLTGTLPADITISAALTDLSLSHNEFHGKVPKHLISRHWTNLDLSYNKFTNSLRIDGSEFEVDGSLSLQQNRLSGVIPGALEQVGTISVLESNLFACDSQRSDLPSNDPEREKYQCGSDTWNATIYAWIAVVGVALITAAALRWRKEHWATEMALMWKWWAASEATGEFAAHSDTLLHYADLRAAVRLVLNFSSTCFTYTMLILLPIYAGVSEFYGTYDHAYAWDFSAAYLSGALAFSLVFVFLMLLIVFAGCTSQQLYNNYVVNASTASYGTSTVSRLLWNRLFVYGSYVALNFIIVLGVNIAYVIIALNQNGEALTLAQISLALFKVAFNGVCSPLLIRWTSHRVLKSSEEASTADLISIQLFVTLVNNILIPCLVVAIISPDCFYNIFNAASEVRSSFSYPGKCLVFDPRSRHIVPCDEQELVTAVTSYNPPFAYSYQCSSSFITYYAPAYVIMCIIASFVIPVGQVMLQRLHSGAANKDTRWFALLDLLLPRILKPIYGVAPPSERSVFAPYFDATQHMITLLTYVGLLLTFGAVFPPLALCFAGTIGSIAVFTKLKVGRFLSQAVEFGVPQYLTVVNQECEGVGSTAILARSIYMMVVFSCLFYTMFLFDTLGDAKGLYISFWILIVVPLFPLIMYLIYLCCWYFGWVLWAVSDKNTVVQGPGVSEELGRGTELVSVEVRSPLGNL